MRIFQSNLGDRRQHYATSYHASPKPLPDYVVLDVDIGVKGYVIVDHSATFDQQSARLQIETKTMTIIGWVYCAVHSACGSVHTSTK